MNFEPIGIFFSDKKSRYEASRQSTEVASKNFGVIKLNKNKNFEQAVEQLNEFSHIWIIFQFHLNSSWKPKVLPPRGSKNKVGVFATRSPYRPNSIGLSAVELLEVKKLSIFIGSNDLLDGTPILDIKPYLPYADSISNANHGWLKEIPYKISFSKMATQHLNYLYKLGLQQIKDFIIQQLSFDPINKKKKRIKKTKASYVLAYRTWRIEFTLKKKQILIKKIFSGYSATELLNKADPYNDKILHRKFLEIIS